MRRLPLSLALSGLLLLPIAAKADSLSFSISGTGSAYNGSGTLTANGNSDGSFTVTKITGLGITGLIAANDPFFLNDNLVFPNNARLFDVNGLAFTGTFGSVNIFSTVAGYEVQGFDGGGNYFDVPVSFSVTNAAAVTPEPSSIVLSGMGLLAIAAAFFRKRLPHFAAQNQTMLS